VLGQVEEAGNPRHEHVGHGDMSYGTWACTWDMQ
jgi:hypothetical protein